MKQPKQSRSRFTVDSIIEAGFICVAERGVANTTTRHIADVAGIGVGTLYEYFKNKEEIIAVMNQYLLKDVLHLIQDISPTIIPLRVEDAISQLIDAFGQLLTANNERYLKVAREILHSDLDEPLQPVRQALMDLVVKYIMYHPNYMKLPELHTMAYIMINASILLVLHHLSSKNPPISFADLTKGLARLVTQYAHATA